MSDDEKKELRITHGGPTMEEPYKAQLAVGKKYRVTGFMRNRYIELFQEGVVPIISQGEKTIVKGTWPRCPLLTLLGVDVFEPFDEEIEVSGIQNTIGERHGRKR